MPSPHSFLQTFNIQRGVHLGGWIITNVMINEQVIKRYHEYAFPIVIVFHGSGNPNDLLNEFNRYSNRAFNILSDAPIRPNTYKCWFDSGSIDRQGPGYVEIKTTGHGLRLYKGQH
jgi:hypothetical protein